MGRFASGKRSMMKSDRSGQSFPYQEMIREWQGSMVHITEYEPKHPQLDPKVYGADPEALLNSRNQDFQTPKLGRGAEPTTVVPPNTGLFADSGGAGMATALLDLPGDFAFLTRGMIPLDPDQQARGRVALIAIGSITVSIS